MSSYAASSMAGNYHPGSSSQATLPAFEHKLPRAHLTSSSGKASPSLDQNPTGDNTNCFKNVIFVSLKVSDDLNFLAKNDVLFLARKFK